jgi:hypothetical protein
MRYVSISPTPRVLELKEKGAIAQLSSAPQKEVL